MTTITKRVSEAPADGSTQRVSAAITEVTTHRIAEDPADSSSKRVIYFDAVLDSVSDPWGGSWGNSWGNSWRTVTIGIEGKPEIDIAKRISAAPSPVVTKRVTGV